MWTVLQFQKFLEASIRASLGAGSGHGLFLRKLGRLNVC